MKYKIIFLGILLIFFHSQLWFEYFVKKKNIKRHKEAQDLIICPEWRVRISHEKQRWFKIFIAVELWSVITIYSLDSPNYACNDD